MSPTKIRTLVVDDEPTARRGVRLLLERDPEVEIVGEAASGPEAVDKIRATDPDLLFLDVQMPELNGFGVLQHVAGAHAPAVVFVTAHDHHALQAFEVNALDYLLKPYDDERFAAALHRAKDGVRRRQTSSLEDKISHLLNYLQHSTAGASGAGAGVGENSAAASGAGDRILLKSGGEIYFLKAEEIDWIEAEGDYMKFHAGGRSHLLRETMGRLEERLDARRFIRIHRSTIVNIDRVKKLSPTFAGEYAVVLHDGTKLRLSRGYHERLQDLMRQAL